jgi:predicted peptidase
MIKRSAFLSQLLLLAFLLSSSVKSSAQELKAHTAVIDSNCHGFYDYLPKGYDKKKKKKKYPLIIMLHGLGELGNGDSDLKKVLRNEPMKLVANGTFPDSFVVNGKEYRFIIFAPQFIHWPWPLTTQAVVDYATAHYNVDKKRIYLTGLSMGGGATWECVGNNAKYAKKMAAIVPVCGASLADSIKAQRIAAANLPVWSLHNEGDRTVTVEFTKKYTRYINAAPIAPKEPARETIFPEQGHNAWRKAYDPLYKENGMNIYEWMLSHHR